jgi:hypothetical protein
VDARIAGQRGANQVVSLHAMRAGRRQQQFQRGPPLTALEARQRADRDPGCGRERAEGDLTLPALRPQARADAGERRTQVLVHAAHIMPLAPLPCWQV